MSHIGTMTTKDFVEPKCSTCGSNHPHRHPAVQFEGEVSICPDEFHLRVTPQNTPMFIEMVLKERERRGLR